MEHGEPSTPGASSDTQGVVPLLSTAQGEGNPQRNPRGTVELQPIPQAKGYTPQGQLKDRGTLFPVIDNHTIFNAEKLLDKRVKNGEVQYLNC